MADSRHILIVRPSALGDVCRTVPVLATLRRAYPQAVIDWVVQADFAAAIAVHPALNEAVCFPRRQFAQWWRSPSVAGELVRWLGDLRRRRYDLVIDCQGLGRSGLITWATRAPRRVGHRNARELGWVGYNVRHPRIETRHTVDQMMSLLVAEGLSPVYDMRLYVADPDRAWWARKWADLDAAGSSYVVLAPTSRWPGKRWPQTCWKEIIGPLRERGFERAVLIGAPSEREQAGRIGHGEPTVVDLVGTTSIGQTMAIVAGADLVIANDSAPLHMAVGLERRCLGLYGPTDPAAVGPWGRPEAVIRPAGGSPHPDVHFKDTRIGDAVMRGIKPGDVLDGVDRVTGATVADGSCAKVIG